MENRARETERQLAPSWHFPEPAEQFFKCGARRPPLLKWGEGKEGQIELFSLCGWLGRLELSDYRTFLESRKRLLHKLIFRCHRSAEVPSNQLSNLWFDSLIKYSFIVFLTERWTMVSQPCTVYSSVNKRFVIGFRLFVYAHIYGPKKSRLNDRPCTLLTELVHNISYCWHNFK